MNTHNPPETLGPAGRALWESMTEGVTYRPDELAILQSACKLADTIALYEAELEGEPMMVRGSQGQPVLHPLRLELRQALVSQAGLLARINVPEYEDEDDDVEVIRRPMTRSEAARKAAQARWKIAR